jgi:hypothetical protein
MGKALARQSRSSAAALRQSESAIRVAEHVQAIVSESLQFRAMQGRVPLGWNTCQLTEGCLAGAR